MIQSVIPGVDSGRIGLLESFKRFTIDETKDLIMPVRVQNPDEKQTFRPAYVYLMRLPDSRSVFKKTPYIIHQLITAKDQQKPGQNPYSTAQIRSIFCVYNDDEQEGGMMLLNLMERVRIPLLRQIVIEKRYKLLLEPPMEVLAYPENDAPYFAGEMISTWEIPAVKREVRNYL